MQYKNYVLGLISCDMLQGCGLGLETVSRRTLTSRLGLISVSTQYVSSRVSDHFVSSRRFVQARAVHSSEPRTTLPGPSLPGLTLPRPSLLRPCLPTPVYMHSVKLALFDIF